MFPELAEALCAWADKVQAALIAVCEAIAGALMVALKALADGIIAGMGIALAGYKAYIAFLQSMADSIQRGEWPDAATMLLDALLTAAGIDPAGFRATFGKIDEIIDDVVENPGAIAMNGAEAVGTGFLQFGDNFLEHFVEGSVEWLTGAANVELPDEFSVAGIFDVCCQVLGLTPEYMREKAVEHVGEGGVEAVEEMYAGVLAFLDGGFAGLWEHVQDKLTGLVDDVVIAIGSWLVEKAILVGRWIAGLAATFGASAILEALIAAWQFAMWIADQMQAMYAIVQSTVDSVYDFVKGNIQPAADKIEGTLANLIAPAIDLVAKLLNISNIADKVQSVIEGVREMIDGAIDSVFEALASALGIGGEKEEEKPTEGEFDGQIGEEIAFSAGGEGHKLWVDASGQVIVASKATPVEDRLDDWEKRASEPPSDVDGQGGPKEEDKGRATAAIRSAREKLGLVEKEVGEAKKATTSEGEEAVKADAEVEFAEKSLSSVLTTLFDIYQDKADAEVMAATSVNKAPSAMEQVVVAPAFVAKEKDAKGDRLPQTCAELRRRVKIQEDALNGLTVGRWLKNWTRFYGDETTPGKGRSNDPQMDKARSHAIDQEKNKIESAWRRNNPTLGAAEARTFVQELFKARPGDTAYPYLHKELESHGEKHVNPVYGKSWLHGADEGAGGEGNTSGGFGGARENFSIGAQWRGRRVNNLKAKVDGRLAKAANPTQPVATDVWQMNVSLPIIDA